MFKSAILAAALTLSPCPIAFAQDETAKENFFGGFDGRWEGTLNYVAAEAYSKDHGYFLPPVDIAFSIKGKDVSVYRKGGAENTPEWREVKPKQFIVVPFKTSAIIATIVSGDDKDGGWVETWNFTVTHKDRDGLYVEFARAVNNYTHPYDEVSPTAMARFFNIAFGEMTRVPAP